MSAAESHLRFWNPPEARCCSRRIRPGLRFSRTCTLRFRGCGDRLVQMIVVFALSLVGLSMARRAEKWTDAIPAALFCLSPVAVRMAAGFYAEPSAALMLLAGMDRVARLHVFRMPRHGHGGAVPSEAGIVAAAFAAGACALRGDVREKLSAIALSLAPAVLWIAVRKWLGYGGVPDWDFRAAPNLGHVAYAVWCEAKVLLGIFVVPIAAVAFLARPFCKPCLAHDAVSAFVPMLFLLATVPLACAFHTSQHSQWMMDNTIPRLLWYISAVPLAVLVQKADIANTSEGWS